MSEQNLIRRKCDYCGNVQEFNQKELTASQELAVESWITLIRMFVVKGGMHTVIKHACRDSCASNLVTTGQMVLPKEIQEMLEDEKRREAEARQAAENPGDGPKFAGIHGVPSTSVGRA